MDKMDDIMTSGNATERGHSAGELNTSKKRASRLDLVLGLECNQRCTFCFNNSIKHRYPQEAFSEQSILAKIEEGASAGITAASITGGEPTIFPTFFKVLDALKRHGFRDIRVITNGMMFHYASFVRRLAGYPVNQISISLHANTPELNDSLTMTEGSFIRTLEGIRNIKRHMQNTQLTAHVVLTRDVLPGLKDHTQTIIDLGFDAINYLYLMPNSEMNASLTPDPREAADILKGIIDSFRDMIYIHIGYMEPCRMPGYEEFFDVNDFNMEFMSNCEQLFYDWKATLIENKTIKDECKGCRFLKICLGYWKP
jgi:radical SAM protein with 4Fe4S-binding SPASM domain